MQGYIGNDGTATDVYLGTSSGSYTLNFTGLAPSSCMAALDQLVQSPADILLVFRYTTGYTQVYTALNGTWPLLNYSSPVCLQL